MITITIQASGAVELRNKVAQLASEFGIWGTKPEPVPRDTQESPPESAKPEEAPKAAKAKKASPRPPVAETEAVEVPPVDATEDDPEVEVDQPPLNDTIADEKVKAEVIRTLQSIYNSGKVQVIRHVLSKYGEGAKSFPEIEASRFPAIKEALARGEIA